MLKALLFDFDGTLFDSTEANVQAYTHAFEDVGITFDPGAYRKLFGLRFEEMMKELAPQADVLDRKRVKDLKSIYYKESLSLVRPNIGLLGLIESCTGTYRTALVTTASKVNVLNLLEYFSFDPEIFDTIVTGEDVANGKPDPQCYQIALGRLGVTAEDACVFEDSEVGIQAAERAGVSVVKVTI